MSVDLCKTSRAILGIATLIALLQPVDAAPDETVSNLIKQKNSYINSEVDVVGWLWYDGEIKTWLLLQDSPSSLLPNKKIDQATKYLEVDFKEPNSAMLCPGVCIKCHGFLSNKKNELKLSRAIVNEVRQGMVFTMRQLKESGSQLNGMCVSVKGVIGASDHEKYRSLFGAKDIWEKNLRSGAILFGPKYLKNTVEEWSDIKNGDTVEITGRFSYRAGQSDKMQEFGVLEFVFRVWRTRVK